MAKGVFISRVDPDYDDLPEVRYHFPGSYLRKAQECIGDWILYYEPRRNRGRLAYYATAKVKGIEPDKNLPGHYYAIMQDYLEFPHPVPYREGNTYYESALGLPDGSPNLGLFQRAIHLLPDHEYNTILTVGMGNYDLLRDIASSSAEDEPAINDNRPMLEQIVARPFRDRAFTKVVRDAYHSTCAFTGLRLDDGKGRREPDAAHIRAVEDQGPDSPRNGMALSKTVHWMFDNGLVSIEDNGKILIAGKLVPERMRGLLNAVATLPDDPILRPHPQFMRFHRENRFKG